MRQRMPRAVNAAEVVDVHQALDWLDAAELIEPRAHADPRVVNERVDFPILLDCACNESAALRFYRDIRRYAYRLRSAPNAFSDDGFEEEWFARGQDKAGPVRAKLVRHLAPDTARAARDDDYVLREDLSSHWRP
jgi:hypothetical protein